MQPGHGHRPGGRAVMEFLVGFVLGGLFGVLAYAAIDHFAGGR